LLSWLDYLVCLDGRCDKALPAAVLDVFEVLLSRKTLDAAVAAFFDVSLLFFIMHLLSWCSVWY
jgi:hypothetical protein